METLSDCHIKLSVYRVCTTKTRKLFCQNNRCCDLLAV